jgi:peptide deformylase
MKTAMQELIDKIQYSIDVQSGVSLTETQVNTLKAVMLVAERLLEKEKEQIMAAKNDPTLKSPLEYYNQTYNQTNVGNDGFEFDNSSTIPPPKTNNL